MKFHHFFSCTGKISLATLGKIHYWLPPGKSPTDPHGADFG